MIGTIGTAAKRRTAVARSIAVSIERYHRSERLQHVAQFAQCPRVRRARSVLWLTDSAEAKSLGVQAGVSQTLNSRTRPTYNSLEAA
jgi:hypothetical protein